MTAQWSDPEIYEVLTVAEADNGCCGPSDGSCIGSYGCGPA